MRKSIWLLLLTFISSCGMAFGQTVDRTKDKNYKGSATIGTGSNDYTATSSGAWLQIGKDSTDKGMILPRVVDTSDIDNPVKGLFVFQNKDSTIYYYTDKWNDLGASVDFSNYYTKDSTRLIISDSLSLAVMKADSLDDYVTPTQLSNRIDDKVDKVTGKGLSTNDYTTAEKTKLSGIAAGAEVNVQSNWDEADTDDDSYIQNKPSETNFSIYNQNINDSVVVASTDKTSVIAATTGNLNIPTFDAGASYVGKIFGSYDVSATGEDVTIYFDIGNRELSTTLSSLTVSGTAIPVEISYVVDFTENNIATVIGIMDIGGDQIILSNTKTILITGHSYNIYAKITSGTFTVLSSYLHRNVK